MKLGAKGQGVGALGLIVGGLIAALVLYSTAGTVAKTTENAALYSDNLGIPNLADNASHSSHSPLYRLGDLFWAIAGIAVVSGVAIGALKVSGVV